MGQYYKPVNLNKSQYLNAHKYGQGLKLMEHSYLGNDLMEAVEVLLTKFGAWHKCKIVWAGDYADEESSEQWKGILNDKTSRPITVYSVMEEGENDVTLVTPYSIDKIKNENKINLDEYHFIVNHTLGEYVDKRNVPVTPATYEPEVTWRIHPLSLLTAEGNGRGGGDYHEGYPDFDKVGIWARHSISVENVVPEGYKEVQFNFKEIR